MPFLLDFDIEMYNSFGKYLQQLVVLNSAWATRE